MSLSTKLVTLTLRMINKYGAEATFVRNPAGTYVSATGTVASTPATKVIRALLDSYGKTGRTGVTVMPEGIEHGDKRLWIAGAALPVAPAPGDTATFTGRTWRVVAVDAVYVQSSVVLYDVQVRV